MNIDWTQVTVVNSLAGGVLLGLSAGLFMMFNGRIAGISGMLGSFFKTTLPAREQVLFLAGLIIAPWLWYLFVPLPAMQITTSSGLMILAGLLVGIGTSLGSGCTSGHGVCGLSRLSPRSLAATLCFMATGFISVFVLQHILQR